MVMWFILYRQKAEVTTRTAIRRMERKTIPAWQRARTATEERVAELESRVAGFDEHGFLARVREMAMQIDAAWNAGALDDIRPFVSEGVFGRHGALIELNEHRKVRNVTADTTLLGESIAEVETDELFDTVHVKILGQLRCLDVPLDRLDVADSLVAEVHPARYIEYWSLLRPREPGLDQGWMLTRISQQGAWGRQPRGIAIQGLNHLNDADPLLSRQALEDRATALFWRWVLALGTLDPSKLTGLADDGLIEQVRARCLEIGSHGDGVPFAGPAVGSVDLVACSQGSGGGQPDRAFAKVRWSALWAGGSLARPSTDMVVMGRPAGAGSTVGLDAGEWSLLEVSPPEQVAIPRLTIGTAGEADDMPEWVLPDIANPADRRALLARMASIMAVDGVVEPQERKLLKATAHRWHISYSELQPILDGRLTAPDRLPVDDQAKAVFLLGLVMAALVDGRVDGRERDMIRKVASSMQMPSGEADRMIDVQTRKMKKG
jgi:hypothetical protein